MDWDCTCTQCLRRVKGSSLLIGHFIIIIYHVARIAKSGRLISAAQWVSPSVCVYVPDDSVRNSSPIFTKFGTDHQDPDGTDEFVGGENRKSTSGFMRMRSKIPC